MRVRARLILSYMAIIAIFIGLGVYIASSERVMAAHLADLDDQFERTAELTAMLDDSSHLTISMQATLTALHEVLLGEAEGVSELRESLDEFDEHLESLAANDEARVEVIGVSLGDIADYHAHIAEKSAGIVELVEEGDVEGAAALLNGELEGEAVALLDEVTALEAQFEQQVEVADIAFDNAVHDLEGQYARVRNATYALLVISVLAALALSGWLSHTITGPVRALSAAAESIESGAFELKRLSTLAERRDEFGTLAATFRRMAEEVRGRELALKEQVEQLQIRIDRARQEQQVAEITDTEFFQDLEDKAAELREKRADKDPDADE